MKNIKETVSGLLSLPKEIVLNLPMVTVTGRTEVNVENYKNIMEYTGTALKVNTSMGPLAVDGKELKLKQVTSENIVVTGEITGLRYVD